MTIQYQIDRSTRRITTRAFGEVTIDEVLAHLDEFSADPSYEPELDVLLDLLDCETLLGIEQIRSAAGRVTADLSSLRFGRLAIVVVSDALLGCSGCFTHCQRPRFRRADLQGSRTGTAVAWRDRRLKAVLSTTIPHVESVFFWGGRATNPRVESGNQQFPQSSTTTGVTP